MEDFKDIVLNPVTPRIGGELWEKWYEEESNGTNFDQAQIVQPRIYESLREALEDFYLDDDADQVTFIKDGRIKKYYARKFGPSEINEVIESLETANDPLRALEFYYKFHESSDSHFRTQLFFDVREDAVVAYEMKFSRDTADKFSWQNEPIIRTRGMVAILDKDQII